MEGIYLAAGLNTPEDIVLKISQALGDFKTTPAYKTILNNWGIEF